MPKRGDFDIEFDNDAELLLAEMEFNDDDKQYEIDMKMKVLDIYNLRLDERIKRKQFVIERDLVMDGIDYCLVEFEEVKHFGQAEDEGGEGVL